MAFRSAVALALFLAAGSCSRGVLSGPPVSGNAARYDMEARAVVADPSSLGPGLAMTAPALRGAFLEGAAPDRADGYGSKGDGVTTGSMTWIGVLPAGANAVAVPVLSGPKPRGLEIHVSAGGRRIGTMEVRAQHWALWRIAVRPQSHAQTLTIQAWDRGAAPDSWLAVGAPSVVRDIPAR